MSEPYVCGPIPQPCRCSELRAEIERLKQWRSEAIPFLNGYRKNPHTGHVAERLIREATPTESWSRL